MNQGQGRDPKRRELLTHVFEVVSVDSSDVVRLPLRQWNGRLYRFDRPTRQTSVNVRGLGNLMERTIHSIRTQTRAGKVRIAYDGRPSERMLEVNEGQLGL